MGFRVRNLNPVFRTCITRLSSSNFHPPVLESLNSHPLESCLTENPAFKIPRRWHLGHSHSHHDDRHHYHKEGENIFRLGLAADIGLATGKAFTGYLSGSTAIIADAAHSVSDVVLSGIALLSFKVAKAPRDKEHPYGHGKFETLGALGISCMLLATGGGIAWHAVDILMGLFSSGPEMVSQALAHGHGQSHGHGGHHHGINMDHPILALNMTIVSIGVKEGLYWITKQAGEKQGSGLMKANAWHHRSDAISSVVALVGVGGSILGVKFLDPLAGLLVSGMILKAGAETGYQSVLELVDAAIPEQHLDPIKQTILQVDGVKGCHRLRGRRAGSYLYLDVHIEVDPFSSVSAAHDIGENVRHQIHKSHPTVVEVFIHIGSTLSPYLFTLILDVLTEQIQEIAPRCMLFADDIVLLGESREELNERLETWRRALETHGFRLSRSKSEYMECKFNKRRRVSNSEVKIGDHIIPQVTRFKYLGSVIQDDGEIEGDVNHRIQAGWMKWRKASGVLCDAKVPIKLKGKFYRTAVRPAILYGTECWAVKSQHENKVGVAEMRMLRWMCGKTRQDKIRNKAIRERVGVAPIVEKMVENRLRWFGHVERRPVDSVVRRVDQMERRQTIRGRGRPKKTIREVIKKDLELNDLDRSMVLDRTLWRKLIHVADPT
ncbi:Metal tolerance protein C1 [Glycine soja]